MSGSPFQHRNTGRAVEASQSSKEMFVTLPAERRLLNLGQVEMMLQLSSDEIQHLIDTCQITRIRIEGHERFCSFDLGRLIDRYLHQARRAA